VTECNNIFGLAAASGWGKRINRRLFWWRRQRYCSKRRFTRNSTTWRGC